MRHLPQKVQYSLSDLILRRNSPFLSICMERRDTFHLLVAYGELQVRTLGVTITGSRKSKEHLLRRSRREWAIDWMKLGTDKTRVSLLVSPSNLLRFPFQQRPYKDLRLELRNC